MLQVGVLTMAGKTPRVLVTPTPDLGKVTAILELPSCRPVIAQWWPVFVQWRLLPDTHILQITELLAAQRVRAVRE